MPSPLRNSALFVVFCWSLFSCTEDRGIIPEVRLELIDTLVFQKSMAIGYLADWSVSETQDVQLTCLDMTNNAVHVLKQGGGVKDQHNMNAEGPNGITAIKLSRNGDFVYVYGFQSIHEIQMEKSITKVINLSSPRSLLDKASARPVENLWFQLPIASSDDGYVYALLRDADENGPKPAILAWNRVEDSFTKITAPVPLHHRALYSPLAKVPLYSAVFYPYHSVANGKLIVNYSSDNKVYALDVGGVSGQDSAGWEEYVVQISDFPSQMPKIDLGIIDKATRKKIKQIFHHYGPIVGDGKNYYQVCQIPSTEPDEKSRTYILVAYDNEFNYLASLILPSSIYPKVYRPGKEGVFFAVNNNAENEIQIVRFAVD